MSYFTPVAVAVVTVVVLGIVRKLRKRSGKQMSFTTAIQWLIFIAKRRWRMRALMREEKDSFRPSTRMVGASVFTEMYGTGETKFRLPPGAKAKVLKELSDKVKLLPDDVIVAAYPKSGTTWTQNIVKLILNRGVEDGRDLEQVSPWVDLMTLEEVEVGGICGLARPCKSLS